MKAIDLHVHSTFSDGTLTPSELVAHAMEMNLSAIALTDHDTIEGIDEAISASKEVDLEIIPGVELSSFYDNKEIHIVGLYINYTDEHFKSELNSLKNIRSDRNLIMCQKFNEIGIGVSYDEMLSLYPNSVLTRAHFADYLLKKGYIKSLNEAFERYIGSNGPCYVPRKKMLCEDAIKLILSAGGVPILAHPVLYHLGKEQMDKLVSHLTDAGLVGIEAIYSTYTPSDERDMRKIAKKNHLLISGGSDYHGANKPYIELGKGKGHLFVPYEVLDKIKQYRESL